MSMNLNDLKWITNDGFERELSGNSGVVLGSDVHPAASWTGSATNPVWTEYPGPGAVVIGNGCYIDVGESSWAASGIVIGNQIKGADQGVMIGENLRVGNTEIDIRTVSVGSNNYSDEQSVSIGYGALSYSSGVAIGPSSHAETNGVAIGHNAKNTKYDDVTIGNNPVRFYWDDATWSNAPLEGEDYNARGNNVFIGNGTVFSIGNSQNIVPDMGGAGGVSGNATYFAGINHSVVVGSCQVSEGTPDYKCLAEGYGGNFYGLTFVGENQSATLATVPVGCGGLTGLLPLRNVTLLGYGARTSTNNSVTLGNDEVGYLYCHTQTISSLSDSRVKEEVELADIDRCLADVQRLPVSRYKYKDFTGSHIDKHVTGFMADDVEKVFPKSVFATDETFNELDEDGEQVYELRKDAKGEPVLDDNGHPILDKKTFVLKDVKKIAINDAIPTLWGAVQALAKRVEALEAEIATLKGNPASEDETTTETSVSE